MSEPRKPTKFECDVLDVVLRELRRAMRSKAQLSILIDPFVRGGAYIFAAPNEEGTTYTIEAPARRGRR